MSLIGQPLPPFSLPDATGRLWTPADLEGRWTGTLLRTRTATFDSLFESVAVFAPDGRLQLWNRRFAAE